METFNKTNKMSKSLINKLCAGLLFSSLVSVSYAQDVHFSQMAYSPLTLNPALAGANSPLQAIVNYRTQWKSVASPYQTIGASFDVRLNENKRGKKGHLGLGVNFFNDQSGDARIATNNANLHLAYHILLDRKSTFGGGLYTGFGQRSVSPAAGKWASQFNGMEYDPTLSSGENFQYNQFSYMDVGAGLVYTYKNSERYMTSNNQRDFNAGLAVYHLNRPGYSFINPNEEQLFMRWSLFANAVIGIENTKMSLMPAIFYQRQKTAQELLLGTYVRYMLVEESRITGFNKGTFMSFGMFYRNKDALVAKAMFEWSDYSVGFAYDVNVSSLVEVSKTRGGFELFLRYNMSKGFGTRSRI